MGDREFERDCGELPLMDEDRLVDLPPVMSGYSNGPCSTTGVPRNGAEGQVPNVKPSRGSAMSSSPGDTTPKEEAAAAAPP